MATRHDVLAQIGHLHFQGLDDAIAVCFGDGVPVDVCTSKVRDRRKNVGCAATFRSEALVGHRWYVQIEAEIVRKFTPLEDVIEEAFVARPEQNRVVGHVVVRDVRTKVQHEQGHRPVGLLQLPRSTLSDRR